MNDLTYRATGRASVWFERALEPLLRHREHRRGGAALDRTGRWFERAERVPVLHRDDEVLYADYPHPAHSLWRAQELSLFHARRAAIEPPVLDFGCGDGSFASVLFERVEVGVDLDPDALAIAREYGIYGRLELATETAVPAETGCARSVISNSVLEHTSRLDAALAEIRRVLRPGGRLFLAVPVAAFREHLARFFGRAEADRINEEYYHRNLLAPAEWETLLRRQGFEVADLRPYQPDWFTYWYRMLRFCGRRGLGRVIPEFRTRFWQRFGRTLVAMVRTSIRDTREGGNIFVVAERLP